MTRSRQTADWGSRAGLAKIVPSSVAVGSGTGSASTTGLVTVSGVSSVSLNDVFSATYNNYSIQIKFTSFAGFSADNLRMRMRVSGSDNTSSNYKYAMTQFAGAYDDNLTSTGATEWILHRYIRADGIYGNIEISNPFAANYTGVYSTSYTPNYNVTNGCFCYASTTVTTSYTGFTLYPTAGTMTGAITVLGYNN